MDESSAGKMSYLLREDESVAVQYDVKKELRAPVEAGTQVGSVRYLLDGQILMEFPVRTKGSVERIGYGWCLKYILERFAGG